MRIFSYSNPGNQAVTRNGSCCDNDCEQVDECDNQLHFSLRPSPTSGVHTGSAIIPSNDAFYHDNQFRDLEFIIESRGPWLVGCMLLFCMLHRAAVYDSAHLHTLYTYRMKCRLTFRSSTLMTPAPMTWWTPSPLMPCCKFKEGSVEEPSEVTTVMLQLHSVLTWIVLRTITQMTATRFAWHKTMKWGTTPVTGRETEFAWKASVAVTVVQVSHVHTSVLVATIYCVR